MQHTRSALDKAPAILAFPDLAPLEKSQPALLRRQASVSPSARVSKTGEIAAIGQVKASTLSFLNMHQYGDLLVNFLRARKKTFVDRLNWNLSESDGMEFDQYDTPMARWVIIHEYGEVVGGIRLTPTTARCGIYSYMLRDAQLGLLDSIPTDVLFFEAPVSKVIWEASRLFITDDVPAHRRLHVQAVLMDKLSHAAREVGAAQVIGIVPAIWSRWLRRLDLDAVPVGPKFSIDGTVSQAALFTIKGYTN